MVNQAGRTFLAGSNIFLGCLTMILQISTLSTLYEWVDFIGVGLWGGSFMISAGTLTTRRHPRLVSMAVLALVSAVTMVVVYSINLGYVDSNSYWCREQFYGDQCDWRIASDIIFIVCGSIGIPINLYLSFKAKSIAVAQPPRMMYQMNNYGRPVAVASTTYVTTTPMTTYPATYPAGQTQVIYQGQAPMYQAQPATYPSPNGAIVYQQQPVQYPAAQVAYPQATTVVQQPDPYPRY